MTAKKSTTSRISLKLGALGRSVSASLEITLPDWLAKAIALVIAHLVATQVFGLDGADALLAAVLEVLR